MYKVPRGTADILPQEQAYWRFVQGKAEALCHLYGYQRLDTPVFEEAGLFIRTIGGLRTFDTILVLTDGGPGRVTEVMNLFAYRMGFYYFDMGKASALGWLMLVVAVVLVLIYIRILRATAESSSSATR